MGLPGVEFREVVPVVQALHAEGHGMHVTDGHRNEEGDPCRSWTASAGVRGSACHGRNGGPPRSVRLYPLARDEGVGLESVLLRTVTGDHLFYATDTDEPSAVAARLMQQEGSSHLWEILRYLLPDLPSALVMDVLGLRSGRVSE
jgi:hypothetical protein